MATLTGDILPLNRLDPMLHAVGSGVLVTHNGKPVGTGAVTEDDTFAVELPDELRGDLEITLALHNSAPTLVTTDGGDLHVTVLYNNVNNFLA